MNRFFVKLSMMALTILASIITVNGQEGSPDVFKKEPLSEQLKYLQEHTRIYENFRAIREDMFQTITKNTLDTLKSAKNKINGLIEQSDMLSKRIDSINMSLEATNSHLDKMTRTKNSIGVLGLQIHKATYNTIMWTLMGIMLLLLIIGYLTFKQNRSTTVKTRKELNDLQSEFEDYKKKTRLEREKTTMEHFNEIKKLKASLPGGGRL